MVDRITHTGLPQNRPLDSQRGASSEKSSGADKTDNAVASADSNVVQTPLMEQVRAQVSASDGIDRAKVDEIKTAIRNGEYQVDADRVAKAFVKLEGLISG